MIHPGEIATIKALHEKLEPIRRRDCLTYEMSTAAMWWSALADILIENSTRSDFPGIAEQHSADFETLRIRFGSALDHNPDYAEIMRIGGILIAEAKTRTLDPGGHLGSLRIIRKTFAFLDDEFQFALVREHIDEAEFVTGQMQVGLHVPPGGFEGPLEMRHVSFPDTVCTLNDLLFRAGKLPSIMAEPNPWPETEPQVQAMFTTVADVLRQHASDVLADQPGAFESLAAASTERYRLRELECERLYGTPPQAGLPEAASGGRE